MFLSNVSVSSIITLGHTHLFAFKVHGLPTVHTDPGWICDGSREPLRGKIKAIIVYIIGQKQLDILIGHRSNT